MPVNSDIFKYAMAVRDSVTKEQQEYIENAYKKWSEDVLKQAEHYGKLATGSSPVSQTYYQQLYKQMQTQSKEIANGVYTNIVDGMAKVSDAVVKDAVDWMSNFGFSKKGLDAAFSYVPQSTVNSLITGSIYGKPGSWSLSAAIWGDNEKTLRDVYSIMSQGVAMQMPIEEMAKKLSQYVSPTKQLSWTGPKGMRIYKHAVDYNAQRLARTLVQHTYQQSFVAATKNNPFVTEYVWLANGSRVCPICADRDGAHFKKDKLPLDHPNGMCTMEPVVDDKMVDKLANWVNGKDGMYPEIDEFAKKFGYDASKMSKMTFGDIKKQYGNSQYKSPNAWYKKLPKDVQQTVSQIHQASGKKWTQWYQDEIMDQSLKKATASKADDALKTAKKVENEAAKAVNKTVSKQADVTMQDMTEKYAKHLSIAKKSKNGIYDAIEIMSDNEYDDIVKFMAKNFGLDISTDAKKDKAVIKWIEEALSDNGKTAAKTAKKTIEKTVEKTAKKTVSKLDDDIDDMIKAAKKAIGELDNHVKSLNDAKKKIDKVLSEYDKDSIKEFKKIKKAQYHEGYDTVYNLVEKYYGHGVKLDFASTLDDIARTHYDDLVDVLSPSLKNSNSTEHMKMLNIKNKLMDCYFDFHGYDKSKMLKLQDAFDELDDLFEKCIGMTPKQFDKFSTLNDELTAVKNKLSITKAELKTQKAIAKGATKEFAGKSYDEVLAWFKSESASFYKNEVVKKSDDFADAIDDIMKKAKTNDIKKAFNKYSSGSIKSEKFDSLLTKLDDYKTGKIKIESSLKKFTADDFTDEAKSLAKLYENRWIADGDLRKWLDDNWDALDDSQKFSVWKYTENSNPINKPLSGYAHGSWDRKDFVGVGNANWGTEDSWRQLGSKFAKKFGKNGTKNIDHAKAIADLTTTIDNMELPSSMYLFRGSDYTGLAGWFEGSGFNFDNMLELFKNGSTEDLKALEGMTVQNHAFTSTAIAGDSGFGGKVRYKIYAPKGTRGVYAEPQSFYGETVGMKEALYKTGQNYRDVGGEAEIILQRGTEFRITDIKKTNDTINIEMEIVDQPRYFNSGYEQTIDSGATSFKH
jgi:hypothetical protein|nr:MAG TPA: VIP2 [Caudoviricetes sp.]